MITPDTATKIAMAWQPQPGWCRAVIDVDTFDPIAERCAPAYMKRGEERHPGSRAYLTNVISAENAHRAYAPTMILCFGENGLHRIGLLDGKHRYAVLRDMGAKRMVVGMDWKSRELAEKFGLLAKDQTD